MLKASLLLGLIGTSLVAQGVPAKSADDDLLALLNEPITVASTKPMTPRESPGIVTVFSREAILASGATDLLGILRLVPGIDVAMDSQGVASLSVRGIWATEGKVLLRVDGQEFNDLRYSSLFLGNNFTPETISRIEIIRGPGSATYGGFAEYAVVNVITRAGDELRGASASITYGRASNTMSTQNYMVSYGNTALEGEMKYSIAAVATDGSRGVGTFTGWDGSAYKMDGKASYLRDANVNIGLSYKGLSVRAIEDRYSPFDFTNNVVRMEFNSKAYEVKYDWKVSQNLTITPKVNYRWSQPWFYPNDKQNADKTVVRETAGVAGMWDISKAVNLAFGVEAFKDTNKANAPGQTFAYNGLSEFSYNNKAAYAQLLWISDFANVTVGGRFEKHSIAGDSFVPRIGVTKVIGAFHFKVLAAKAFRAPVGENINRGVAGIKAEKTTTVEVETGYQFSQNMFATVNVFNISTNDPMVWSGGYTNSGKIASKGAEATLTWRGAFGSLNISGAYHENHQSTVPDYAVPENDKTFLGSPRHKVTLYGNFKVTEHLSLAPSVISIGSRYGYDYLNQTAPTYFKPVTTANLFAHYKLVDYKLTASLGVNNVADTKYQILSGYAGSSAPINTLGREVVARLGYNF